MTACLAVATSVLTLGPMKIIVPGREQKGWSTEAICTGNGNGDGGCNAKLLVEQDDLFTTAFGHHDGSTDTYVTFKCEGCGVLTDLPDNKVPSAVVSTLPTHRAWETRRNARAMAE